MRFWICVFGCLPPQQHSYKCIFVEGRIPGPANIPAHNEQRVFSPSWKCSPLFAEFGSCRAATPSEHRWWGILQNLVCWHHSQNEAHFSKLRITKFFIKISVLSKNFPFLNPSCDLFCVGHLGLTGGSWSLFQLFQDFGLNYFGLKYAEVISIELQKSWVIPCTFICLISYRIILWVSRGSSLAGTTFSLDIFARITGRDRERERGI